MRVRVDRKCLRRGSFLIALLLLIMNFKWLESELRRRARRADVQDQSNRAPSLERTDLYQSRGATASLLPMRQQTIFELLGRVPEDVRHTAVATYNATATCTAATMEDPMQLAQTGFIVIRQAVDSEVVKDALKMLQLRPTVTKVENGARIYSTAFGESELRTVPRLVESLQA